MSKRPKRPKGQKVFFSQFLKCNTIKDKTKFTPQTCETDEIGDFVMRDGRLKVFLIDFPVPGAPEAIKAVVKSPRSVVISWLPPNPSNGMVDRYHIYLR